MKTFRYASFLSMKNVPRHVAIIMDGNGRWAQQRGLPRLAGHEQGSKSIRACVEGAIEAGVEFLTLYAFSSENWKRPALEVQGLMRLLERFLDEKLREMQNEGVRLQAIGRLDQLPDICQRKLSAAIAATAANTRLTVILALSYSGRSEIVDAVKSIVRDARDGRVTEDDITPEFFSSRLYTADIPDPDLLIRTSGEMRVSNFLLWQLSYTEIHVAAKYWPDFRKEDFLEVLKEFSQRSRRFGAL
ncbi:MAG TPA: isoprenyl transferase [Terrimicrobiaceae bacterium]|nr:isoprenyl transferase [Terrimicrobiaceae bacterium]